MRDSLFYYNIGALDICLKKSSTRTSNFCGVRGCTYWNSWSDVAEKRFFLDFSFIIEIITAQMKQFFRMMILLLPAKNPKKRFVRLLRVLLLTTYPKFIKFRSFVFEKS